MTLTWEDKWKLIEKMGLDLQIYADHSPVKFWVSTRAEIAGDGLCCGTISDICDSIEQAVESLFEKYTNLPEGFYIMFKDYGDGTDPEREMCMRWNPDWGFFGTVPRTIDKNLFGRYH